MARIKNIELPGEKHTCIGLTAIYGIGRNLAKTICENVEVDPAKKIKDLTEEEIAKLENNDCLFYSWSGMDGRNSSRGTYL